MIVRAYVLITTLCFIQCATIGAAVDEGLYDEKDNVTVFNGDNLLQTLSTSKTLWLVEYYSSWCGHCQEFSPIFKALAKDVAEWHMLLKVGVINCPNPANLQICRNMSILDYPTLRFYPAFSNSSNPGETYTGDQGISEIRREIINYISRHINQLKWTHERPKPILRVSGYEEVMNELSPSKTTESTQYTAVIFEDENSYIGKEVILDTSSCTNLFVRRVNVNRADGEQLAKKLDINLGDLPQVVVIHQNKTVTNINVKLKSRHFFTYQLTKLPGVGEPIARFDSPFSQNLSDSFNNVNQVTVDYRDVKRSLVYLADIESAIRYALTMEVTAVKVLEGKKLNGLKTFISAFTKLGEHMPGRPSTLEFMLDLEEWLRPQQSINYNKWAEKVKEKSKNRHLPPTNKLWVGCQPSKPSLRRYPCSLWTLFHTMTVASFNAKLPDQSLVPDAMASYIINFFGCRECRINFMKEIKEMPYKNSPEPFSAILWLWRIHNSVNERLHANSSTEDPAFPKIQFPPMDLCPNCQNPDNQWDESNVAKYLIKRYSKQNVAMDYVNLDEEENDETNQDKIPQLTELTNRSYTVTKSASSILMISDANNLPEYQSMSSINNEESPFITVINTKATNLQSENPLAVDAIEHVVYTKQTVDIVTIASNNSAQLLNDSAYQSLDGGILLENNSDEILPTVSTSSKATSQTATLQANSEPNQPYQLPRNVNSEKSDESTDVINPDASAQLSLVEMALNNKLPDVIQVGLQTVAHPDGDDPQSVYLFDPLENVDEAVLNQIPPPRLREDHAPQMGFPHEQDSEEEASIVENMLKEDLENTRQLESVIIEALVRPVANKIREKLEEKARPPISKQEIWEARLQNVQVNKDNNHQGGKNSFHPRALGSNVVGRRGLGSFSGSFRLQLGFNQMDFNLCLLMWVVSIGGALCLFWGYKFRRTLFSRKKNYKHVM